MSPVTDGHLRWGEGGGSHEPKADNLLTSFRRAHAFSGLKGVLGFAVHFYGNSKSIFFSLVLNKCIIR